MASVATKLAPAEAYLSKVCPVMRVAVKRHAAFPEPSRSDFGPYEALARSIAYQQLSGKAAATIYGRVLALYDDAPAPPPDALLETPDETLRGAGLSRQKIAALKDLAQKRLDGIVPAAGEIEHLPDDEIVARLTAVRGVGRWTVEMYLIFTLGRPDVWPVDDLGVRKGAERLFETSFTPKTLMAFGEKYSPWRSAMAWLCWRATEIVLPAE
jgi:3-methyladenine DNA glycosylase/8-oxoguanine DNA glycosylase